MSPVSAESEKDCANDYFSWSGPFQSNICLQNGLLIGFCYQTESSTQHQENASSTQRTNKHHELIKQKQFNIIGSPLTQPFLDWEKHAKDLALCRRYNSNSNNSTSVFFWWNRNRLFSVIGISFANSSHSQDPSFSGWWLQCFNPSQKKSN